MDKYISIPEDTDKELISILGVENFKKYFHIKSEIKVNDALSQSDMNSLLKTLIEAVGRDKFAMFFKVSRKLIPDSSYTRDKFQFERAIQVELNRIVKQIQYVKTR
jgi:hypothetical protein